MKNNLLIGITLFAGLATLAFACVKDPVAEQRPAPLLTTPQGSFVEEFDSVGSLTRKGWTFKNNSNPVGQTGWRQGRYEAASSAQYKFLAPVPYIGFPAYSATTSPNDFISCDVSAGADATTSTSDISAWLISPQIPVKNGDRIVFYTRAVDDSNYPVYTKDRMQVRANFVDGTTNVGKSPADTGSFTRVLLDINPKYINNDPGSGQGTDGYPRAWTKYTITVTGISAAAGITNGRIAFRYLAQDAGLFGGIAGTNYPTVVGIDSLAFVHN